MRMVVVLPQPEGPSSTRNSLSTTSRFMFATAMKSPKLLVTSWNRTDAMDSALYRAEGQAADQMFLHDERKDHDRNAGEEAGGADLPPIGVILRHPPGNADRQRLRPLGQSQDDRQPELVLVGDQAEDGRGRETRPRQRQRHPHEGTPPRIA